MPPQDAAAAVYIDASATLMFTFMSCLRLMPLLRRYVSPFSLITRYAMLPHAALCCALMPALLMFVDAEVMPLLHRRRHYCHAMIRLICRCYCCHADILLLILLRFRLMYAAIAALTLPLFALRQLRDYFRCRHYAMFA